MSKDRNNERRIDGETVRAEDMADDDDTTRGTVTEQYTVAPKADVVRTQTTRREEPQEKEETVVRQPQPPVLPPARPVRGDRDIEIPESYALGQDRVRWPAVFAGLLTALTLLITFGVLGLAIGLTSVDAGNAVARGVPSGLGLGSGLWAGISALLAFLIGGWVAGRTAAVFGKGWGALNGMLVFLLAVPLLLWLASSGVGALLGSLGTFAQSLNINPNAVQDAANQAVNQAQQTAQNITPAEADTAAQNARNAAWSTLLGLGLATAAATLGGLLGTRSDVVVDRDEVANAREGVIR